MGTLMDTIKSKIFEGKLATQIDYNEIAERIVKQIPLYYDNCQIWYKWHETEYRWKIVDETDILIGIQEEFDIANITRQNVKSELS